MDVLHRCCAGLDVHQKTVVACVRRVTPSGEVDQPVRTFGTMTDELIALAGWLAEAGVVHIAMESTGVYWKPVYNLLEGRFAVILVNAQHIKQVPGRKTDVKDCQWIAQLLQHGLLRASFVPPRPIRELRDLTRQRTQLIRQRATLSNRIQKVLEDANIKLASVASEVLGVSCRAMIAALIGGEQDPTRMAELAKRRLRVKIPQLRRALHGHVTEHHRFQLRALMEQVGHLEALLEQLDGRIAEVAAPYVPEIERLVTIPGVNRQAAEGLVAELGVAMGIFPTSGHLCSWAGMAPGNHLSAGKRQSGRTCKANRWLRPLLIQVAWAASRSKGTRFEATYRRWAKRLGRKRALVGIGHKVLKVIYEVLKGPATYQERLRPEPVA
jgi:transposase